MKSVEVDGFNEVKEQERDGGMNSLLVIVSAIMISEVAH